MTTEERMAALEATVAKQSAQLKELAGGIVAIASLLKANWQHPLPADPEVVVQRIKNKWLFSGLGDDVIAHAEKLLRTFLRQVK